MIGKIIKFYAYARAPRLTFTVSHPKHAARLAKTSWDLKHAWAPRVTGIAALAMALPFGFLLGRASKRSRSLRSADASRHEAAG
jgi:hypothetical protein